MIVYVTEVDADGGVERPAAGDALRTDGALRAAGGGPEFIPPNVLRRQAALPAPLARIVRQSGRERNAGSGKTIGHSRA